MNGHGPVFVDTNVFVYAFDRGAPEKRRIARTWIRDLAGEGHIVLSVQVLQEFFVAVTRKLTHPLSAPHARRAAATLAQWPVIRADSSTVLSAADRVASDMLSFWDALIIEAALGCGAGTLLTEDLQRGRRIDGITIVDPFGGGS